MKPVRAGPRLKRMRRKDVRTVDDTRENSDKQAGDLRGEAARVLNDVNENARACQNKVVNGGAHQSKPDHGHSIHYCHYPSDSCSHQEVEKRERGAGEKFGGTRNLTSLHKLRLVAPFFLA